MSIEGQGHFFTIYFPDFVCFVLYRYLAKISGERLQDHWFSGLKIYMIIQCMHLHIYKPCAVAGSVACWLSKQCSSDQSLHPAHSFVEK